MSETKTKPEPRVVVESVPNARRYSDGTILLMNVRASYPHVFEPQENTGDDGKVTKTFAITGLMDKATHAEAKTLCVKAINAILKESNKGQKLPADRKFLKDGDPKDEEDVGKPENAGQWVVTTREQKRPILLDNKKDPETGKARRLNPKSLEDIDMIYGGCYVDILIRPWWQDNKYGKRVNAGITAVQFRRKGEPFGNSRIKDDDIDDTFDAEDADEDDDDGDL